IAKRAVAGKSRFAVVSLFFGAAGFASDDHAFLRPDARSHSLTVLCDSFVIPGNFHPFVRVIGSRRLVLLKVETQMVHYGWFTRQNLDRCNPGVFLERNRNGYILPIQ